MDAKEVTWNDVFRLLSRIESKVDKALGGNEKYVPRTKIVREIGRRSYENGVRRGILNPVKNNEGRNSKAMIQRKEYEFYLSTLKR